MTTKTLTEKAIWTLIKEHVQLAQARKALPKGSLSTSYYISVKKMTDKQKNTAQIKSIRIPMILFIISSILYIINVLIAKANIVYGWKILHFGNVGEFLIMLIASVALIIAALQSEAVKKNRKS